MLIYLKEEGVKYRPDIIILGFMSMDSERNMLEFRDYAKPRFRLVNNKLKVVNFPVPAPEVTLEKEIWRSKFLDLLKILGYEISLKNGSYGKEREGITNAILTEIVNTAKGVGAIPVIAYISNVESMDFNPGMTDEERRFIQECDNISVRCVFLRQSIISAKLSGAKIKKRGHFDPETNWRIAFGIKEYLLENNLFEWNRNNRSIDKSPKG